MNQIFQYATTFYFNQEKVPDYCLYGNTKVNSLIVNSKEVGAYAFSKMKSLSAISANQTTTKIGEFAFNGCTAIQSALFWKADSVKTGAFAGCMNLQLAEFNAVKYIGEKAFNGLVRLKSIKAPKVVTIAKKAFCNCVILDQKTSDGKSVYSFDALKYIGDSAFFQCDKLSENSFTSKNISTIGNYAFYKCKNLKSSAQLLGDGTSEYPIRPVTSIGAYAFANTGITKVVLSNKLETLGDHSFPTLKELEVYSPKLMEKQFNFFDKLDLVNDGTGILKVGGNTNNSINLHAMFSHPGEILYLKKIILGNDVKEIHGGAFYRLSAETVSIGRIAELKCNATSLQMLCTNNLYIDSYKFFSKEYSFTPESNCHNIFGWDFKRLTLSTNASLDTLCASYAFYTTKPSALKEVVNASWTEIGTKAFYGNEKLELISLENVKTIREGAFANCNLYKYKNKTEVTIEKQAFANNPLYAIILAENNSTIDETAFEGCTPHMVLDLTDQVVIDNNKENVKFLTKTEKRAKELKASPYNITHVCSLKRMNHTAEDVTLDGSLSGEDVQQIYNAMK